MNVDPFTYLKNIIESLVGLNDSDLKIVLCEMYETTFGIHNHAEANLNRPMSTVAFHPKEDYTSGGPIEVSMRNYVDKEIHKYFGLSYKEFMLYPHYEVTAMLEIAKEKQAKQSSDVGNALVDMRKLQSQLDK